MSLYLLIHLISQNLAIHFLGIIASMGLPSPSIPFPRPKNSASLILYRVLTGLVLLLMIWTLLIGLSSTLHTHISQLQPPEKPAFDIIEPATARYATFERCSIDTFLSTGFPWLELASPIPPDEFIQRRNNLAIALAADGVDAFIVEPGYTFKYYANVSQKDWEVWEPEERPFLMIIRPENSTKGDIVAKTTFLAPHFEEGRVRMLGMPFDEELSIITWEEHWNPYEILLENWNFTITNENSLRGTRPKVMVDEEMRDFIQRGLGEKGFHVYGLGGDVERVRQTKTKNEVEILRAVNTGTVEAVRAMRKCLKLGLSENEVKNALDNTMRAAGMEPFFDIVLFGDYSMAFQSK